MPLIEWRDEFTLGLPSVDHEHRELIALINALHARLSGPEPASNVLDFLGDLHAQISAHFALEEKLMRERGYDQYQDHKDDHEALLDEIRDIMDGYEDSDSFDEARLSQSLKTWFTEHFRTKDARLHKYMV